MQDSNLFPIKIFLCPKERPNYSENCNKNPTRGGDMEKPIIKRNGANTSISFYTLDCRAQNAVESELSRIFTGRNCDDYKDIIYTCVKELMVNASKTNIKKTFFVEAKINPKDREIYELAKRKVKKLMTDEYFSYLRSKLQKHNQHVEVSLEDCGNGVVISVKNPSPLLTDEEEVVRKKLQTAMSDEEPNLALYFNSADEDNEGASLGLILVVNLLRQVGISPELFRIGVVEGETVARIEIPLDEYYEPRRRK